MNTLTKKIGIPKIVVEYVMVLIGAFLIALSFNIFLLPNHVASGGISGVSTILNYVFKWEPAFVLWSFNIPLFIIGFLVIGKQFGIKTLVATLFSPLAVYLTASMPAATDNPLLAALFGGIGIGLGLGIVFRANGSTGGTDVIAQIIHKYMGLSLGASIIAIDAVIVTSAAIVFSLEGGMYALVALFVTGRVINMVLVGLGSSKMALIITKKEELVKDALLYELDRGVTRLSGHGGYTNDERPILMCVVDERDFTKVRTVVRRIDKDAFIVVTDATEVLGRGFKKI